MRVSKRRRIVAVGKAINLSNAAHSVLKFLNLVLLSQHSLKVCKENEIEFY